MRSKVSKISTHINETFNLNESHAAVADVREATKTMTSNPPNQSKLMKRVLFSEHTWGEVTSTE